MTPKNLKDLGKMKPPLNFIIPEIKFEGFLEGDYTLCKDDFLHSATFANSNYDEKLHVMKGGDHDGKKTKRKTKRRVTKHGG